MEFSQNSDSLSSQEKAEMLADAEDDNRREDFRKARSFLKKTNPEDYIRWMTKIFTLVSVRQPRLPVVYKNVLL